MQNKIKKYLLFGIIAFLCAFSVVIVYRLYTNYRDLRHTTASNVVSHTPSTGTEKNFNDTITMRRNIIICLALLIAVAITIYILITLSYNINHILLWGGSIFCSLSLCAGIVFIWYLEMQSSLIKQKPYVISSDKDATDFLAQHKKNNPGIYKEKTHYLSVGFLFYAININREIVTLYCYPWLKKNEELDKGIKPNFIAMNATKETKTWAADIVSYDHMQDASWQEQLQVHMRFDYSKYPFDQQQITVLFEHEQSLKNIILMPDFIAYKWAKTPFPPLDKDFIIHGWEVKNAYFFYELSDYPTDFGIRDYWQVKNYPFLGYTIQIQRKIYEPLITSLLPIIIILFITFAVLLLLSHFVKSRDNITVLLALLSSLFFANILSYQILQEAILTPDITYFKSFYIITYAIIFTIAINCLLYAYQPRAHFIIYKNNLLIRLLYWPAVLCIFFLVTLVFFY